MNSKDVLYARTFGPLFFIETGGTDRMVVTKRKKKRKKKIPKGVPGKISAEFFLFCPFPGKSLQPGGKKHRSQGTDER